MRLEVRVGLSGDEKEICGGFILSEYLKQGTNLNV